MCSNGHYKQNSTSTNANPQTFFHNFPKLKYAKFVTTFSSANANATTNYILE